MTPIRPLRAAAFALALAATAFPTGCGGPASAGPPSGATVPARGTVTYRGKPLTRGTVVFEPDAGREAQGEIGPDGTFVLTTFAHGDGAMPGAHRVSVSGLPKAVLPLKYRSAGSSGVVVEVSAAASDYAVDFQ